MTDGPTAGVTDQSLLRRINIASTLMALRRVTAQTLREVSATTGLSWRTTNELVDELTRQGWVEEVSPELLQGRQGRPARRFRFRTDAGYVIGIDVGGHKALALCADLDGTVLAQHRVPVDNDSSPATRLAAVRGAASGALRAAGIDRSQLLAVTVGTVGVVNDAGKIKRSVIPEWTGVDLAGRLARSFPCPILVDNDCNLGAVAELWQGAARDCQNAIYVLAGLRTGAGLIIRGQLHRGHHGAAGEIGALRRLDWEDAQRHFGNTAELPDGAAAESAAAHVFAAARSGDEGARRAVDAFAHDLATGIAAMVLTIDPELVVVGGGYAPAGDVLLEPLQRHLAELCLFTPRIEASNLGDQSVALGAVRLALDHVDRHYFSIEAPASTKTR